MYRLALAYLFRRPVQLLAVLGVAVGLLALLVVTSVMNGLIEHDRASVRGPLSDLLLMPAVTEAPAQWDDYGPVLKGIPEIHASAPHLVAYAVLGLEGAELRMTTTQSAHLNGVQLVGIDPDAEAVVSGWTEALQNAQVARVAKNETPFALPPDLAFPRPGVLVSDNLARILPANREVVRMANGHPGFAPLQVGTLPPSLPPSGQDFHPHNAEFYVAGTYHVNDYQMSLDRIYMERMGLDGLHFNLLGESAPDFTEALIKLAPGVSPQTAKDAILSAFVAAGLPEPGGPQGGALETWEERRSLYLGAIAHEQKLTTLVMSFIVLVAAFGLFTTLSSLVREKIRDLGILSALGFSPLRRALLLLLAGSIASGLGSILGFLGAHAIVDNRQAIETFLQERFDITIFDASIYVLDGVPAHWDASQAQSLALLAFALGLIFTLIPALHAARLSPVESLRYE